MSRQCPYSEREQGDAVLWKRRRLRSRNGGVGRGHRAMMSHLIRYTLIMKEMHLKNADGGGTVIISYLNHCPIHISIITLFLKGDSLPHNMEMRMTEAS